MNDKIESLVALCKKDQIVTYEKEDDETGMARANNWAHQGTIANCTGCQDFTYF